VLIMDAGIASADNIAWLSERGYLYLVVSRERDVCSATIILSGLTTIILSG